MNELTLDEALEKGLLAHRAGQLDLADKYYSAILKSHPTNPVANHKMGLLAMSYDKFDIALHYLRTAAEIKSSEPIYWLSFIDALLKLNRFGHATVIFEQAQKTGTLGKNFEWLRRYLEKRYTHTYEIVKNPPTSEMRNLIALHNQGNHEKTLKVAQRLLLDFQQSPYLYEIIGTANKMLGLFDKSIAAFENALRLRPNHPETLYNIGSVLQTKKLLNDASEHYNFAILLNPSFHQAHNNLGNVNFKLKNFKKAIESYQDALVLKADYVQAHNNLSVVLLADGRIEEAMDACNKALSIMPDYAEAQNTIGNILKGKGRILPAIRAYRKAISINPKYAAAYNNLGTALNQIDEMEEAWDAYDAALSIAPDNQNTYHNVTETLKEIKPTNKKAHLIFSIDDEIRKLSPVLINSITSEEVTKAIITGLDLIDADANNYRTSQSQIYKRSGVDLNCSRHKAIFDSCDVIPAFCFGCFKVQVEVATLVDLIKLTSIFYNLDYSRDLTRKTMVELRPEITGFYKGLIYCRGIEEANDVKKDLDEDLKKFLNANVVSRIKRGCSEFPLKFPEYGTIDNNQNKMMFYPENWKCIEDQFDAETYVYPKRKLRASLPEYCLSDFYIIRKWIDYAKGINDPSIEHLSDMKILYPDVYKLARNRLFTI